MELLFDENEIDVNETKKFMAKSGSRRFKKKMPKKEQPVLCNLFFKLLDLNSNFNN